MATKTSKTKGKKTVKKHIVVFQDQEGNVLKTAFVPDGEAAPAPEVPKSLGKTKHHEIVFAGWSEDFKEVHANLVVKAEYVKKPKNYLVMYYHEDGKLLGMESVPYNEAAQKKLEPKKAADEEYNYPFLGWSCNLDHIQSDTNAKAVFGRVRKSFQVRFYHEDGTLLKEERVIYGKPAHAPEGITKATDPTYHYTFKGWNRSYDKITGPTNIKATFEYIYNEYPISFYNQTELVEARSLHYGDEILFPDLYRKGYTLHWDHMEKEVTKQDSFVASWEFTNHIGKVTRYQYGLYQVINPSISNGSVKCLQYQDEKSKVIHLPDRVKLGDYYYKVELIGERCFTECKQMEKLYLPDTLKQIEAYGISDCKRLKEVTLGKGIQKIGAKAFVKNQHLKKIHNKNKNYKKAYSHKLAFSHIQPTDVF